ncbi:AAA family ATPase [Hyalangium rubrum]|uniref:AAA family ATPase n=1 Tax=Hyalangium rubrum TaxID=3103134 RepID=A0ABU5HEQ5_9BACT|nr:AAA family ATPase [Hyalangium sp. s54d21]MDY7231283.1 AAA family ATPase [Hyalangium sp. s54d21]
MIRSVRFENFRCLREVELPLEPLTVLVGPQASGKTAVLDGLDFQPGCDVKDYWRQEETGRPVVEWRYENGRRMRVEYPLRALDSTPMQGHTLQALALDLAAMREEGRGGRSPVLNRTGDNLSEVFAALPPEARQRVVEELCRLVPTVGGVELREGKGRTQRLRFRDAWREDLWISPDRVGDTVLVLLAYLVLPYQRPPPDVLTVDMPERGLPPWLLGDVMAWLRGMTTGKLGGEPVQVVLATSSPELLEHVSPEEVRVFSREPEDGSVRVSASPEDVADWRQRLAMM